MVLRSFFALLIAMYDAYDSSEICKRIVRPD